MAEIRPYTSQIVAQGARADAADFGAQVGAATMNLGGGIADVSQAMFQQEVQQDVNDIQVQMAKARAEWTTQLRDRANQAKPGDQTFTPKLMDDMDKYFEGLSQNVRTSRGKQVFATLSANMKADFLARGVATQAKLAADGAKLNVQQLQDASGQTVFNDPTQRQSVLGNMAGYIDNLTGIDQATKMELKRGAEDYVNRMTVIGQIQRNPDELLARINPKEVDAADPTRQLRTGDAAFDALPAEQQFQLVKQAREYSNAYRVDDERKRREAEREKAEAQEAQMTGYTARILAPGGQNGRVPSAREIMADPLLDSKQKEHLVRLSWAAERERSDGTGSKSNPTEVRRLLLDIYRDEDDPKKTYSIEPAMEAYRQGKISTPELMFIRKEVDNLRDPDKAPFQKEVGRFRQIAEKALMSDAVLRGLGRASADVIPSALQRFNADLDAKINEYRQAGKNPRDLLTPGTRDYFLNGNRMSMYVEDATTALARGVADGARKTAPAEARRPGETPEEYMKRTGK